MVPVLVLLVLPLQLQDWELVRVFQSAEITNTDKSGTEASVSAAFELDGEQTLFSGTRCGFRQRVQVCHIQDLGWVICKLLLQVIEGCRGKIQNEFIHTRD